MTGPRTCSYCQALAVWQYIPNGARLCDDHARYLDLDDLEDLRDPEGLNR